MGKKPPTASHKRSASGKGGAPFTKKPAPGSVQKRPYGQKPRPSTAKAAAGSSDGKKAHAPGSGQKRPFNDKDGGGFAKKPRTEPVTEEERKTGKELKQARKLHKPHGEIVVAAKRLWEEIRAHNTEAAKRKKLVTELCSLIKGHMHDVIFRHDAARVVQCVIQFGTPDQRQAVFEELKEHLPELMKSTYGKFVVTKMLDYGTKEQKAQIISTMHGQVRKLIKHQDASTILESAFRDHANAAQRNALVQEFYAAEFGLFQAETIKTFGELLASQPEKKDMYTKFLQEAIMGTVNKGTVTHSIVHRVLREFMENAEADQKQEMASAMSEHIVSILHTRDGSIAAMHTIWNASAKDRKQIIKSFKTHVGKIAREEHGHHVLLALFDAVDDTVSVRKSVLNELIEDLPALCADKFGRLVVLYLLSPRNGKYLHPAHITTLTLGDANAFSKKDRDVRLKELRGGVSKALLEAVAAHPEWAYEGKLAQVVEETLLHATGAEVDRKTALEAVVSQIAKADDSALTNAVAGLLLKRLVLSTDLIDKERIGESVWRHAQAHAAEAVETMQGCYTLAALLDPCQPPALRTAVATVLARLALPAPDAQGENGKPLPKAVLAKAVQAAAPAGTSGKAKSGGKTPKKR